MDVTVARESSALEAKGNEAPISAVSWAAVIAGAIVAAAMGLILLSLGAGIGLASVSPWGGSFSVTSFTVFSAVWLIVVQWLSSAFGGYLTGRLRTKWVGVRTEEVFFRDTAHGLLTWAAAVVIGAGVLASVTTSIVGGIANGAPASTTTTAASGAFGYFVDNLFRNPTASGDAADARAQATRIFVESARNGAVSTPDRGYLGQLVAARTGLSQSDADKRVDDVLAQAKAAADSARKATSRAAIFTFFSLLIGAFIACVAGAIGGHQRDLG